MQQKFTWKGFKIALIGVAVDAIALFIRSDDKLLCNIRLVLILIGSLICFAGIYIHNKEMFKSKEKKN